MLMKASECRYRQACSPSSFRQRLHCAVFHHRDLKPEEIAARAEIPLHILGHYANDNQDRHIPAERLVAVVRVTGRMDLFEALLAELDHLVVPNRQATPMTPADVAAEVLDATSAHGRVSAEVRAALADGRVERDEAERVLEAIRLEQRELAELVEAVRAAQAPTCVAMRRSA